MAEEIVKFYGVKETIKLMRKVEPQMLKDLRKDIRRITAPAVSSIRSQTPSVAPLSGMVHNGRTAWTKPKVTTSITFAKQSFNIATTTSRLVTITATGQGNKVGFDIADMAGRKNQPNKYPRSRKYVKNGVETRHRLNGQGQALIRNLPGRASRYVYSNIESKLPQIRQEVANTLDRTIAEFNRKLMRF